MVVDIGQLYCDCGLGRFISVACGYLEAQLRGNFVFEVARILNDELIAGERRWRASQKLGLETVPVIVRKASDREVLEMALVENLQRQDLNAIEEANGYIKLSKEFGMKQDEIAKRVGKSRAAVANSMRLLDLHKDIQKLVANGLLSVGHAKAILGIKVKREQRDIADQVMRRSRTVRATEKLVQNRQSGESTVRSGKGLKPQDPETEAMVRALTSRLDDSNYQI